jgi:hypothetical protein
MIYDTNELKAALPDGIICVVTNGHWSGDLNVKTGDSTWANIPRSMQDSDDTIKAYAKKMLNEKSFNVSPAPPGKLKVWFEEENVNKVLGMVAGTIERANRLQRVIDETAGAITDLTDSTEKLRREVTRSRY